MKNKELYHYGVKGMKWGVRKEYVRSTGQNLSKKAKQITSNFIAKRKARKAQEEALAREKRIMKTSVKKLTTSELQERARILAARKQVLDLERNCKQANAETISAGKRFISKLGTDMITPALTTAGKNVLIDYFTKIGKDKLGLSDKDNPLSSLKKQAEEWGYKKTIYDGKSAKKRYDEMYNPSNKPDDSGPKPPSGGSGNSNPSNKPDDSGPKPPSGGSGNSKHNKSSNTNNSSSSTKTENYTGTVEGEGTSKRSSNSNTKKEKSAGYYDPIDSTGEWVNERSTSIVPASSSSIVVYGKSKLNEYNLNNYLLEDKNR